MQDFHADDYCRPCRGKGYVLEQSATDYRRLVHVGCTECGGTGWRGAKVEGRG